MAAISIILLVMPAVISTEIEQRSTGFLPVEQQLIRKGELVVKLQLLWVLELPTTRPC
jgi:hypothetical protein